MNPNHNYSFTISNWEKTMLQLSSKPIKNEESQIKPCNKLSNDWAEEYDDLFMEILCKNSLESSVISLVWWRK